MWSGKVGIKPLHHILFVLPSYINNITDLDTYVKYSKGLRFTGDPESVFTCACVTMRTAVWVGRGQLGC